MDKRRFRRLEIRSQQRIYSLSSDNQLDKNVVFSKNLSASGLCIRSSTPYEKGTLCLVHLDDAVAEDIRKNLARVIKSGGFLLAKVVWNTVSELSSDPFYHVGCTFIEPSEKSPDKVDLFLHLVNRTVLENFAQPASACST